MSLNTLKFAAIPQARFTLPVHKSPDKAEVTVYELEPSDTPVLDSIIKRVDSENLLPNNNGDNDLASHYENIRDAATLGKHLLKTGHQQILGTDKPRVLLAVSEQTPCGLLVSNGDGSRNEIVKLIGLATWPKGNLSQPVHGIGKALLLQLFSLCNQLDKKAIEAEATPQDKSIAVGFYEKMRFKNLGKNIDDMIDIEISQAKYRQTLSEWELRFEKNLLEPVSVPLEDIVDLRRFEADRNKE